MIGHLSLIVETLACVAIVGFQALLFIQNRDIRSKQAELNDSLDDMRKQNKEFELRDNGVSGQVAKLASSYQQVDTQIAGGIGKLAELETQLRSLAASLTSWVAEGNEIQSLKAQLERSGEERKKAIGALEETRAEVKILEDDYNSAARKIGELNVELSEVRKLRGTEEISPERSAIQEALKRAADLASNQGATAEAKLAYKTAEEEGATILKALDAAQKGDSAGAATIIDASFFDPFAFHPQLWEGTIAAKRTMEMARAAAVEAMGAVGFVLDKPRIGKDVYDRERHDLRDSLPTPLEELWGKIAEVRRPGFIYNGKIVRPARVVQYAMETRRSPESSNPTPMETPVVREQPIVAVPSVVAPEPPTQATSDQNAKRKGVDGF